MTWQKATALVPLALLSGAWTASLAGASATAAAADGSGCPTAPRCPPRPSRPRQRHPARRDRPRRARAGEASVVADASTNGIPAAALAAYQRAAQVIDTADKGCRIDWTLIAAIGRVESDHGRYGGNTLTDEGVSHARHLRHPARRQQRHQPDLRHRRGRARQRPGLRPRGRPDAVHPSTWSVVGVDGDGDGVRNPQDIDDAALATAVYLCSGNEDLSTEAGRRRAVYRYNHSERYVDLVLSIMQPPTPTATSPRCPTAASSPAVFTRSVATPPPRAAGPKAAAAQRPPGRQNGGTAAAGLGGGGHRRRRDPTPAAPTPAPPRPVCTGGTASATAAPVAAVTSAAAACRPRPRADAPSPGQPVVDDLEPSPRRRRSAPTARRHHQRQHGDQRLRPARDRQDQRGGGGADPRTRSPACPDSV